MLKERKPAMLEFCSEEFVNSVFLFVEEDIIKPNVALRRKLGLNDGESSKKKSENFSLLLLL